MRISQYSAMARAHTLPMKDSSVREQHTKRKECADDGKGLADENKVILHGVSCRSLGVMAVCAGVRRCCYFQLAPAALCMC